MTQEMRVIHGSPGVHPRRVYQPTDPAMKKRLKPHSKTVKATFETARAIKEWNL
jgi:hypothetical protein